MADCKELFGIILDPCGVVISSVEGACKKESEELWNSMYPEEPYELDLENCCESFTKNSLMASPSTKYDLVSAVKRQSSFYYQVIHFKSLLINLVSNILFFVSLIINSVCIFANMIFDRYRDHS